MLCGCLTNTSTLKYLSCIAGYQDQVSFTGLKYSWWLDKPFFAVFISLKSKNTPKTGVILSHLTIASFYVYRGLKLTYYVRMCLIGNCIHFILPFIWMGYDYFIWRYVVITKAAEIWQWWGILRWYRSDLADKLDCYIQCMLWVTNSILTYLIGKNNQWRGLLVSLDKS